MIKIRGYVALKNLLQNYTKIIHIRNNLLYILELVSNIYQSQANHFKTLSTNFDLITLFFIVLLLQFSIYKPF